MNKSGVLLSTICLLFTACATTTSVSTEELKAPFSKNRAQVDECYVKVMKKQPDIGEGTVELKFLINEDGNAYKTIFMKKRSTLGNKLLNACIKKVVQTWQFPEGKALEVVYPFQFEKKMASLSSESKTPAEKAKSTQQGSEDVESQEPKKQTELDIIDTSPPSEEESTGEEPTPTE